MRPDEDSALAIEAVEELSAEASGSADVAEHGDALPGVELRMRDDDEQRDSTPTRRT